ncbi:hypothetical protein [Streptomyces hiroshimensis]|uniref:LPXTG cell wall anchor domain-containing protein n=1 Tax=Streptomyces hiroshimensis TaxID=66424 RepID=A0ABQ2Y784_9ACTN|nr:hypothetical protein [Streptomyces hiroshimensis]GGX69211.1 hypothetical protein GCM10010324_12670 [Streptomyces hiroshimensis]
MDSVRLALCGALAAVAVCAPAAHANDEPATMSGTIELTPVSSHPGGQVQLRVAGCGGNRATAASEAFVTDAKLAKDSAGLFAEATVRGAVDPGVYPVRVNCDGYDAVAEGKLTVVPHGKPLPPSRGHDQVALPPQAQVPQPSPQRAVPERPSVHPQEQQKPPEQQAPVAPVPAGGGGTAAENAPGTPGLVLAGITALIASGLIWHRRRTESSGQQ